MTFDVMGAKQSSSIFTGVRGLLAQDYPPLAALVFFSAILAPALYLLFGSYVLTARLLGRSWPWDFQAYRAMELLAPWNLVPVFFVACMVAVVRLDLLGTVTWQRGAVFVVLLSICCLILEQIRENAGQESDARLRPRFDPQVKRQRALALVVSGVILYPFANILPVMTMTVPGDKAALTVWGGVLELFHVGLWPAAVIVFLASMCVPFLKLAALGWFTELDVQVAQVLRDHAAGIKPRWLRHILGPPLPEGRRPPHTRARPPLAPRGCVPTHVSITVRAGVGADLFDTPYGPYPPSDASSSSPSGCRSCSSTALACFILEVEPCERLCLAGSAGDRPAARPDAVATLPAHKS